MDFTSSFATNTMCLSPLSAQMLTILTFIFIASWPLMPILVQWRPWGLSSTLLFLLLLFGLAWVLLMHSSKVYSGIVVSWLVLMLTGLTAIEYTSSQLRMYDLK
mmetsp:Transcript_11892/g.14984  ORF Transcript_11892/g.14984 Transcript_11892/m.14984 type:complete len:104 (+) Transcript_11892:35-346(+)